MKSEFATAKTVKPKYGGMLRIVDTYTPPPRMGVPGRINVGGHYLEPIVDKLLRLDKDGKVIPHLVESWEYDKEGLRLILHLRKGVKFHDGTEFNAESVKWNLLKARESKAGLKVVSAVDVIDEHTALLTQNVYDNHILPSLALASGYILSPTAYNTYGEAYCLVHPIGTGSHKFVSYEPNVKLTAERFDGYWQKGKPFIDKIEFIYVKDLTMAANMLRKGEVDAVVHLNGTLASALKSEGFRVAALPWNMESLLPDSGNIDSVLANKRVRQAIEYAIDRPALAETLGHDYWSPLTQLATEKVYGYNPAIEGRPYNPEKARELLKEAGYPHGLKMKLIGGEGTELLKIFTEVQKYLGAVGIKAEIEIVDLDTWKEYRAHKPWYNAALFRHFAIDPNFAWAMFGFHSATEYGQTSILKNFDNLVNEMVQARDDEMVAKATQSVVKHIYDEAIVIPMVLDSSIAASSNKVHDLGFFETHMTKWSPFDVWKE
jgi:peptide/nickel transport system substrate-binding protein